MEDFILAWNNDHSITTSQNKQCASHWHTLQQELKKKKENQKENQKEKEKKSPD